MYIYIYIDMDRYIDRSIYRYRSIDIHIHIHIYIYRAGWKERLGTMAEKQNGPRRVWGLTRGEPDIYIGIYIHTYIYTWIDRQIDIYRYRYIDIDR